MIPAALARWEVAAERRHSTLLFFVTLGMFLPTLWSFHGVWASPTYAHGYLVAAAAVWLVWRERGHMRWSEGHRIASMAIALCLSLLWLCASIMDLQAVAQATLPPLFLAWVAAGLGSAAARRLGPIAAFALLAVPVWEVLLPPLRAMTIFTSGLLLRLLDVPAVIRGDLVEIEFGTFQIADGCAGLSYLLAGLTVGSLYGFLFCRNRAARLRILAFAAGIAIVGNWIRVASLIVIGQATRMQSSLLEAHLLYGWAIFAVGLLIFFALARRVGGGGHRQEDGAGPGGDFETVRPLPLRERPSKTVYAHLGATLAATVGPLLYYAGSTGATRDVPPPWVEVGSAWSPVGEAIREPSGWRPAFRGASQEDLQIWTDGSRRVIGHRLVYTTQRQGAELIGYDNRIAPDSMLLAERLLVPVGTTRRLVNEAIVRSGDGYALVWYWYRVGGIDTESAARAKLLELWAFVRRTRVSELIAFSTICDRDSCTEASRALYDFLGTESGS